MKLSLRSRFGRGTQPRGRRAARPCEVAGRWTSASGRAGGGDRPFRRGQDDAAAGAGLRAAADSGRAVRLDGAIRGSCRAASCNACAAQLFLAPQVPPLPPRQRVVTAVLAGRLPSHRPGAQPAQPVAIPPASTQADAALARFDLSDKLFARVDRLSGGERQRVGPGARAAVRKPRLLAGGRAAVGAGPDRAPRRRWPSLTQAGARNAARTLVAHACTTCRHGAARPFRASSACATARVVFDLPSRRGHARSDLHDAVRATSWTSSQGDCRRGDEPPAATCRCRLQMHCR